MKYRINTQISHAEMLYSSSCLESYKTILRFYAHKQAEWDLSWNNNPRYQKEFKKYCEWNTNKGHYKVRGKE